MKLEALLDKTLKETQRAREGILELERLKTENLDLQSKLKNGELDVNMGERDLTGGDPGIIADLRN